MSTPSSSKSNDFTKAEKESILGQGIILSAYQLGSTYPQVREAYRHYFARIFGPVKPPDSGWIDGRLLDDARALVLRQTWPIAKEFSSYLTNLAEARERIIREEEEEKNQMTRAQHALVCAFQDMNVSLDKEELHAERIKKLQEKRQKEMKKTHAEQKVNT
ncbi:hypothetical protein AA313_de0202590 [Arthrobotrys entomopaga]|nr:hypothetical protein AA313_de0202590 [Arthrobotrys entomopaga]